MTIHGHDGRTRLVWLDEEGDPLMALHLIPEDDSPHSATSECGCGPVLLGDNRTYAHADTEAYNIACRQVTHVFEAREAPLTLAKLRETEATRLR